jgi:hypothetical protein
VLAFAGLNAASSFDFVRLVHWMNALAAAGSISMLWLLCYGATGGMGCSWAIICTYAFSNAFLLHATSTAEPMVGLFWSLASVTAVARGLTTSSRPKLFLGGMLLLLSMATYESMVMIGPAELILIYLWDEKFALDNLRLVGWFLAGCLFGLLATYVPTYILSGTYTPMGMFDRFIDTGGGEQVYGGMGASKLLNLPMGFANSIVPILPQDYQGIRFLLGSHSHDRRLVLVSGGLLLLSGWLAWTGSRLYSIWSGLERRQRLLLSCCAVALGCDMFPLIFWDPIYDKLWLQPVAVTLLACGMIVGTWYRRYPSRLVPALETTLTALVVTTGFASMLAASRSPTPCMGAARDLAGTLRPSDLIVGEWDPISLLYSAFWGNGAARFDVPTVATASGPGTMSILDGEIARTSASGARIYLLGVVDMPQADWNPYLGSKCHLPYSALDEIRRCARPVSKLVCEAKSEVLWQLSTDCYNPK